MEDGEVCRRKWELVGRRETILAERERDLQLCEVELGHRG